MLPIIYDIAIKNDIRPERPMAASSIASQMGIIASPVSVAVVTLTTFLVNAKTPLAGFDGYLDFIKNYRAFNPLRCIGYRYFQLVPR